MVARHVAAILATLPALALCAVEMKLENASVSGHFNILGEAAYLVGLFPNRALSIDAPCRADGPFDKTFNIYECVHSAEVVKLKLKGEGDMMWSLGDAFQPTGDWAAYSGPVKVSVPALPDQPITVWVNSCGKDSCDGEDAECCTQFSFIRSGKDVSHLGSISIKYPHEPPGANSEQVQMSPRKFDAKEYKYKLNLTQDEPFTILATAVKGGSVGIEWIDWEDQDDRLGETWVKKMGGEFSSCRDRETDPVCKRPSITCDLPHEFSAGPLVREMAAFTRNGGAKIVVCAIGDDLHKSSTRYTLDIEVRKYYSSRLKSLSYKYAGDKHGKEIFMYPTQAGHSSADVPFDPNIKDWTIFLPDFSDPKDRLAVKGMGGEPLVLQAEAEENGENLKAGIVICSQTDSQCLSGSEDATKADGEVSKEFFMEDNERLHRSGTLPTWEEYFNIMVTSPDLEHTSKYLVKVKQNVSAVAFLSGLEFGSPCDVFDPKPEAFDPDKYQYRCSWEFDTIEGHEDDAVARFTPSINTTLCPGCEIQVLNPSYLAEEDTLYEDFTHVKWQPAQNLDAWKVNWQTGNEWKHTLLLGERHVFPVKVVAADHSTHKDYHLLFEYECPWYLSATFSRMVSNFVSTMAIVMAVGSAGNIMALSKQIQFMVLTTFVGDSPDTYKQFAKSKSLSVFSGDFDGIFEYPPFCYLPSVEDIQTWIERNFVKVAGLSGDIVTELSKYCAVREMFADDDRSKLAANMLICYDKISWDALSNTEQDDGNAFKFAREYNSMFDNMSEETSRLIDKRSADCGDRLEEIEEEEGGGRRLGARARRLRERARRLIAVPERPWTMRDHPGWNETDIMSLETGTPRRLTEDLLDAFEDEEPDSVLFWDDEDFDDWFDYAEKDNITAELYPDLNQFCKDEAMDGVMNSVHWYQTFSSFSDTLTGDAGSFIGITLGMIIFGSIYYFIFRFSLYGSQKRLQIFEPGNLLLFSANVLYIPFSMSAGKLMFIGMDDWIDPDSLCVPGCGDDGNDACKDGCVNLPEVEFFDFPHPDLPVVWVATLIGLLAFPIAFVLGFTFRLRALINSDKLVYTNTFGKTCWADPECKAAKVAQIHWFKKMVPVAPGLLDRVVRMCVPILTKEGQKLEVPADHKTAPVEDDNQETEDEALPARQGSKDSVQSKKSQTSQVSEVSDVDEDNPQHDTHKRRKNQLAANLQKQLQEREHAIIKLSEEKHKLAEEVFAAAREEAEKRGADDFPPWMPDEDENICNMGLYNLAKSWESKKEHVAEFRLEPEESFAMKQYLRGLVNQEKRLLAYNIMRIEPQCGYLKAREPCKPKSDEEGQEEKDPSRWWLDSAEDYEKEEHIDPETNELTLFGHHPHLYEYKENLDYIENNVGERLVYMGHHEALGPIGRCLSMMRREDNPFKKYGRLEWMKEPEEGWESFETEIRSTKKTKEENAKLKKRYADKWQWITFEYWIQPWAIDDVSEMEWHINFCGYNLLTYNPAEFIGKKFFLKVRKAILQHYKEQVPDQIHPKDKNEIRKWVFGKLMLYMDMKMKLLFFADQHPDYTQKLSLEQISRRDFHETIYHINSAQRNSKDASKKKGGDSQQKLIDYAIMKVEDTYEDGHEPWWEFCDAPREEELKVQFDQESYWMDHDNPEHVKLVKENHLVPKDGFHASRHLMTTENATVGVKRYVLRKPDSSETQVRIDVELEHVPSLMTYVTNFKLCIGFESLDLPERSNCEILVGDMGAGEQFNFGVEGFTLILAICVLNAQGVIDKKFMEGEEDPLFTPGSLACALAFLFAKGTAFIFSMYQATHSSELDDIEEGEVPLVKAKPTAQIDLEKLQSERDAELAEEERKEKEAEAKLEKDNNQEDNNQAGANQRGKASSSWCSCWSTGDDDDKGRKKITEEESSLLDQIIEALKESEQFTLLIQTILLLVIFLALFTERRELLGLVCILLATTSMILVGFFATLPALKEMLEEQSTNIEKLWDLIRSLQAQQVGQESNSAKSLVVSDISMTVPDLGLTFGGEVEVDPEATAEEQRKATINKKLLYWTVHQSQEKEEGEQERPASFPWSIHDQSRFDDVKSSISVALTADQMMLCQPIPQIVACIQCVNHCTSSVSQPRSDSFLTLFKPAGWQPEFDWEPEHRSKVDEMHKGWEIQVANWFTNSLGAVETERTATRQIKDQLLNALEQDASGNRQVLKVRLRKIGLPKQGSFGKKNLDNTFMYVTVVSEYENMVPRPTEPKDFPVDRMSGYFRCAKKGGDRNSANPVSPSSPSSPSSQTSPTARQIETNRNFAHIEYEVTTPAISLCPIPGIDTDADDDERAVARRLEGMRPPDIDKAKWNVMKNCDMEECDINVPISGEVGEYRLLVWAQTTDRDGGTQDELVAFTSRIDLAWLLEQYQTRRTNATNAGQGNAEAATREAQLQEKMLHCVWQKNGSTELTPVAGEDNDDDDENLPEQKKRKRGKWLSCCSRRASKDDTSAGFIQFEVVPGLTTDEEKRRDDDVQVLLKELLTGSGDSQLTLAKIERHADCWPLFSRSMRIRMEKEHIERLERHLEKMNELKKEVWGDGKNPLPEYKDEDVRKKKFVEKEIRRVLCGGKDGNVNQLKKAIKQLQDSIQFEKLRLEAERYRLARGVGEDPAGGRTETKDAGGGVGENQPLLLRSDGSSQAGPVASYNIKARCIAPFNPIPVADEKNKEGYGNEIVNQLRKMQDQQSAASRQILHYVLVSDHIKPNKNWRPDPIPPHVAAIVAKEIEDVPLLAMTGFPRVGSTVEFERDQDEGTRKPLLVNGRLCFVCNDSSKLFEEGGEATQDIVPCYMYWNGNNSWIVSESRGAQLPKVIYTQADRRYLWLKDHCSTPDQAQGFWFKAKKKKTGKKHLSGKNAWEQDPNIAVTKAIKGLRKRSPRGGGLLGPDTPMYSPGEQAPLTPGGSPDTSGPKGVLSVLYGEISKLFADGDSRKVDPELKECLVSMTPKALVLTWKDNRVEQLAPFRQFLLQNEEYLGDYQKAWQFLTPQMVLQRNTAVANLSRMLEETTKAIEKQKAKEQKQKDDREKQQPVRRSVISQEGEGEGEEGSAEREIQWNEATLLGFLPPGQDDSDRWGDKVGLLADQIVRALDVAGATDSSAQEGDGNLSLLEVARIWQTSQTILGLPQNHRDGYTVSMDNTAGFAVGKEVSIDITGQPEPLIRKLTDVKKEQLTFSEPLPEELLQENQSVKGKVTQKPTVFQDDQAVLQKFQEWVFAHPVYQDQEDFWAAITDDEAITEDQFLKAVLYDRIYFMKEFLASTGKSPHATENECKREAKSIFQFLDAQGNGSVTLAELVPTTGEDFEDTDCSLLKFTIPLAHISEISTQGNRRVGPDKKQTLRINVKPQFEEFEEEILEGSMSGQHRNVQHFKGWAALRRALDPDWEPVHGREHIEVCMQEKFFEIWRTVATDSDMLRPQEWIQHYDGEIKDHEYLSGFYCRDGKGTQRWDNGTAFIGEWKDHTYHGQGELYQKYDDYVHKSNDPIYSGEWKHGKKHGKGTFTFVQVVTHGANGAKGETGDTSGAEDINLGDGRVNHFRPGQRKRGISKVYVGQFRDDLFHGKGYLRLERASTMARPGVTAGTKELGVYPSFTIDSNKLREFEGEFDSSYVDTYLWIKRKEKTWNDINEESGQFDATIKTVIVGDVLERQKISGYGEGTKSRKPGRFGMSASKTRSLEAVPMDSRETSSMELFDWSKKLKEHEDNPWIKAAPAEIRVLVGDWIDEVQFVFRNGDTESFGKSQGGRSEVFLLGDGEYIASVMVSTDGESTGGIQFVTSTGRYSAWYGDRNGSVTTWNAKTSSAICGLEIKSGGEFFQIDDVIQKKIPDREKKAMETKNLRLDLLDKQSRSEKWKSFMNYFGGSESNSTTQWHGLPMTDIASKAYGYRGGDSRHFKDGRALYADGTIYEGQFKNGKPHGKGKMEHHPIVYEGEWEQGKWHGIGKLTHSDGYEYVGEFKDMQRNGQGVQTNSKLEVIQKYGYSRYDGTWVDDQRHGRGKMEFGIDVEMENSRSNEYLHEGEFVNGKREGPAQMYFLIQRQALEDRFHVDRGRTSTLFNGAQSRGGQSSGTPSRAVTTQSRALSTSRSIKVEHLSPGDFDQLFPKHDQENVKILYFSGMFENDKIATERSMAWLHLVNPVEDKMVGQYYYGQVTADGVREGFGTLWNAEVVTGEGGAEFLECVMANRPYTKEVLLTEEDRRNHRGIRVSEVAMSLPTDAVKKGPHLQYLIYSGQWKDNLPHGVGVQFYPDVGHKKCGGVYDGEFKKGRRHGRGTWTLRDKSFRYLPVPDRKGTWNWQNDMMHGVAQVEDRAFVHENVVYSENKTVMPFTSIGPPATNFEQVAGWHVVFKGIRHTRHAHKKVIAASAAPKLSMAAEDDDDDQEDSSGAPLKSKNTKSAGLRGAKSGRLRSFGSAVSSASGFFREEDAGVWGAADTTIMQRAAKHAGKLEAQTYAADEEEANAADALIREPTELVDTMEDLHVSGGTAENEAMNGFYFKVSNSFGHSVWRMAKKDQGIFGSVYQRWLYKDDRQPMWFIGPKLLAGPQVGPGCAQVEDETADGPSTAKENSWVVWNPAKGTMTDPADLNEETEKSIDRIVVKSVIGFTISTNPGDANDLNQRLLLRCSVEFFHRPVYETEDGSLFMYWFKKGASTEEGLESSKTALSGNEVDPKKLFANAGYWVVSKQMGKGPPKEKGLEKFILAFSEDAAATPFQIAATSTWWTRSGENGRPKSKEAREVYEPNADIRLHLQEWDRKNPMLEYFNSEGENDSDCNDDGEEDPSSDEEYEQGTGELKAS